VVQIAEENVGLSILAFDNAINRYDWRRGSRPPGIVGVGAVSANLEQMRSQKASWIQRKSWVELIVGDC
jgi:hypothetical protein